MSSLSLWRNKIFGLGMLMLGIGAAMILPSAGAQTPSADQAISDEEVPAVNKKVMLDTLELKDMDINDCLKLLAAKSGLNIIAGKSIQGRVTIFLQNVEVHDALTIILKTNDLAYIEDHGIVQILTAAEYDQTQGHKFGMRTERKIITLQTVKAADALALLTQIKSPAGKVIADEQSNTLMIEDVPDKLKSLEEYIKSMDVPTQLKVFKLRNVSVEGLADKFKEMASPKIGSVRFDVASNKIFIKDTDKKLEEFEAYVRQIDIPRETQVFDVNYAKAEDISKTVTPMLTKGIGTVQFDARSNKLVVTDITPKIAEMRTVIASLDKHEKEVLIEARIVQVDLTDKYKMGINWTDMLPNGAKSKVKLANDFGFGGAITNSLTTVGTLNGSDYGLILEMLATLGKTRTLSNPRIAVVNNQEATIHIGSSVPYVTTTTTNSASGLGTTAEAVTMIDVGIKLAVTPTIHDDNYITMKIKPEVSSATKSVTTSQKNEIPIKDTSEVDTTVRVKDGVTIVIGGLIKDEVINKQSKIPLLADLPLLGKAFRSDDRSVTKTEIVIFLTPRIITGDVHTDPDHYPMSDIKGNKTYAHPFPNDSSIQSTP